MEHWGLIIYREESVLVSNATSEGEKVEVTSTVFHEIGVSD
jgi:aminopeptidase N